MHTTTQTALVWHNTEAARRILAQIDEHNIPSSSSVTVRGMWQDDVRTVYDEEDARVIALKAVRAACFEMAEALAGSVAATVLGDDVDTVIAAHIVAIDEAVKIETKRERLFNEGLCKRDVDAIMAGILDEATTVAAARVRDGVMA